VERLGGHARLAARRRRLSLSQRLDRRGARHRTAAGDGVDFRGRVHQRARVMGWFFGGAYTEGAGSSRHNDGEALARKGAVLVTFNYRLGPFGFFSHPELTAESGHNASGNQALADSLAVLRWVKTNIAAFGGDPNNVTIFGESA